jgi:hypothetical protein
MTYQEYRKDTFERLSKFDIAFKPWKKWENVKLSDMCPCNSCEINKEVMSRQHEIQMSGGLLEEITEPCGHCMDSTLWKMECIEKLGWYEDKDERFR